MDYAPIAVKRFLIKRVLMRKKLITTTLPVAAALVHAGEQSAPQRSRVGAAKRTATFFQLTHRLEGEELWRHRLQRCTQICVALQRPLHAL